jgi:hypothetical protein
MIHICMYIIICMYTYKYKYVYTYIYGYIYIFSSISSALLCCFLLVIYIIIIIIIIIIMICVNPDLKVFMGIACSKKYVQKGFCHPITFISSDFTTANYTTNIPAVLISVFDYAVLACPYGYRFL